ncbi:MAG: VWA domain-containing protein [Anaerolineaceae bacterium]|nr:VWA domain-containing protein [Anaerolineaceae bacterium]
MLTRLCRFLPLRQPPHPNPNLPPVRSRGQVIVIFAVSLVTLLLFVGLAIDAGMVYVSYGQLKRAVDSASVAAATNFKRNKSLAEMEAAALETLVLHNVNVDPSVLELEVRVCDADSDGIRDAALETEEPDFFHTCPDTTLDSPRKLIWVEAQQRTPLYFLTLIGFRSINLRTHATAEAAAVDLILVVDVSESMVQECKTFVGSDCVEWKSPGYSSTVAADYDPQALGNCNYNNLNDCHPLREAKDAAKDLVNSLYEGYDRVSVITFSTTAQVRVPLTAGDLTTAGKTAVLNNIDAIAPHDDPPFDRMWSLWADYHKFNPAYPDDRDGDGADYDPAAYCDYSVNAWWDTAHGNVPCDLDDKYDAFNWDEDENELFTDEDQTIAEDWMTDRGENDRFALVSTCTGCAMRMAANQLKQNGRPGAVWVIVFLSDGAANMSDTPLTGGTDPDTGDPVIPWEYPNGFCTQNYWGSNCFDTDLTPRYCLDETADTCPPNTTWEPRDRDTSRYSVYDYALDMIDETALTVVRSYNNLDPNYNQNEPIGNDVAIYAIGLGDAISYGESLLRYMAAVGDDGDRNTNPCALTTAKRSCGNYYYAATGADLLPIFEDIASRIYTRITQ